MILCASVVYLFIQKKIDKIYGFFENSYLMNLIKRIFRLINKKLEAFKTTSISYKLLVKSLAWLKNIFNNSYTKRFLLKDGFLTEALSSSKSLDLFEWLVNCPIIWLNKLIPKIVNFDKDQLNLDNQTSKPKELFSIIDRYVYYIFSGFLLITFIIPDKKWHNMYSTIIIITLLIVFILSKGIHGGFQSNKDIKTYPIHKSFMPLNIKAFDSLFILFILSIVLSFITSLSLSLSIRFIIFYLTCFCIVLLIVSLIKTKKNLENFIEIILIGVTLSGCYGVFQHVTHSVGFDPSLTDAAINQGMPGRIFSTMGNPNNYAEVLVMTIPFFLSVIANAKTRPKRIVFILLLMPSVLSLFYTGSRSGFAAFAFSICLYIFYKNKKFLPWAFIIGVSIIPLLPEYIYRRILTIFSKSDSSVSYRRIIFESYWQTLKEFWATGLGLGTDVFMKIIGSRLGGSFTKTSPQTPVHTHILYTQLWIETGFIGFITFLWFIARLIKRCSIKIFNKADIFTNNILMSGICGISGVLIIGFVEYIWYYPRVMLVFWMNIGIILAGLHVKEE